MKITESLVASSQESQNLPLKFKQKKAKRLGLLGTQKALNSTLKQMIIKKISGKGITEKDLLKFIIKMENLY